MKQLVRESIGDLLKPKGVSEVLDALKNLSVNSKITKIKQMQQEWGGMYKDLINNKEILNDIRGKVKDELNKLDVIEKINYIEKLESELPDIFSGMRDDKLINDLKTYILTQEFDSKTKLIWRFFKSWPDLFKNIEDDPKLDEETNKIMILFRIKRAIDKGEMKELQKFIHNMGEKYGRKNIIELASKIQVPDKGYYDNSLFNKKDLEQLKLSLFKETRNEEEKERDEVFDVYAFIGYADYQQINVGGEEMHKKMLGIENLVKIDKYNTNSLVQISMMKIRANAQYGNSNDEYARVWAVYIPKYMWDKDHAYNKEIPDDLRKFINENKFKV